jgi:hypothetical protein
MNGAEAVHGGIPASPAGVGQGGYDGHLRRGAGRWLGIGGALTQSGATVCRDEKHASAGSGQTWKNRQLTP